MSGTSRTISPSAAAVPAAGFSSARSSTRSSRISAGVRVRSETADDVLLQLGDVVLHPVRAEMRLLDERLQIRDEPQIAGRARGLHRLREPAFGLDRGSALTADERQRAGQQVFSRREHQILIADAECDDALRFRIDADVERRAGGLRAARRCRASAIRRSPSLLPTAAASRTGTRACRCRTARAPTRRPPGRTPAPCRAARRRRSRTRRTRP